MSTEVTDNRAALLTEIHAALESCSRYSAPRSAPEAKLVDMWRVVLPFDDVFNWRTHRGQHVPNGRVILVAWQDDNLEVGRLRYAAPRTLTTEQELAALHAALTRAATWLATTHDWHSRLVAILSPDCATLGIVEYKPEAARARLVAMVKVDSQPQSVAQ